MLLPRRWFFICAFIAFVIFAFHHVSDLRNWYAPLNIPSHSSDPYAKPSTPKPVPDDGRFHWSKIPERYPVTSLIPLPSGQPEDIPKIQHSFSAENSEAKAVRIERLEAIKESFVHSWTGYKQYAWLKDEVSPVSHGSRNIFGGWAATLVDTLDTLWIMGLEEEFEMAVEASMAIDFTTTDEATLNIFETTIRYLGGFLSAYDLSGGKYSGLLDKAIELGEFLYLAFDTPNRMPVTRWGWENAAKGMPQEAGEWVLVAEIGSLCLEFTRLSQLSKDPKYFDAIQRITDAFEKAQLSTKLPGMWPVVINAKELSFSEDNTFSIGAMADSLYEYLPKQHMLLGGLIPQYRNLYESTIGVVKKNVFYKPMTKDNNDILLSGNARINALNNMELEPQGQHLACFAGGMVGMASKIFDRPEELPIARQLLDGCLWAYDSMASGIMPETFHTVPCPDPDFCVWDEKQWYSGVLSRMKAMDPATTLTNDELIAQSIEEQSLQPGFTDIPDRRYILRPEAIESIFILYRITGDTSLLDAAWKMFQSIQKHTQTDIANAAIDDVTKPEPTKSDRMESFWMAETLKYFYLIFSEPDVINLDEYVL
ncbi:MAG: hypothetical protein M1827_002563 [Pycnora praestabilis]|nr:MAG: hypothetical protein M1827_002563 [Pycnora praestabilis]